MQINTDRTTPAFPTEHTDTSGLFDGMTLRDYFAAKAMQTILNGGQRSNHDGALTYVAECAYAMADAMMEARK